MLTSAAVSTSNSIHSLKVCMQLAVTSWWFENTYVLIPVTTVVQGNGYAENNGVQLGSYGKTCHNTYLPKFVSKHLKSPCHLSVYM
jgi:hypothetical protein